MTGDRVGGEIETKRLGGCVMMSFTIRTRPNGKGAKNWRARPKFQEPHLAPN